MQTALRLLYPPQCMTCDALTDTEHALCGACWRDTPFLGGSLCDACGAPLPGEVEDDALCDDCLTIARPWSRGRAAMIYDRNGRRIVLALKHGDRLDLVKPAAHWMAGIAAPLLKPDMLIVPVPLHWRRLLRRRYNQAAQLAQALGRQTGQEVCVDALARTRHTRPLDGLGKDARFAALGTAIAPHRRRGVQMAGRPVLLIDDVMTSGATLAAATEACFAARASEVCILTLARVVKDA